MADAVSLVLENAGARLELSPACGAVLSLRGADGAERVVPASEAFTLQLLDGAGVPTRVRSSKCAFAVRDGGLFAWRHASGLEVSMRVRPESGESFAFTPEVRAIPDGMLLEWFDGPQIRIANNRLLDETARAGSAMLLGCEASAATPYVPNLFFNDSREGSGAAFGRPVPGVPFVFHEWMCNFSGNQGGHTCDPFYRWTRAFHCGDMMALVLGRDGRLTTAWGVPWDEAAVADEEALVRLVRDFCALRRRHPEFLLEGRMILPFVACASPRETTLLSSR